MHRLALRNPACLVMFGILIGITALLTQQMYGQHIQDALFTLGGTAIDLATDTTSIIDKLMGTTA